MNILQTVYFYLPDEGQVQKLASADMDADYETFSTGVQVWIGQTYLRLLGAGYPVELRDTPPETGTVVVHADHAPILFAKRSLLSKLTIVVVRADRPAQLYSDFEIVQNRHTANKNALYVQHWPQPGLLPRDPSRGSSVRNATFKGSDGEMADGFKSAEWKKALADEGVEWHADTAQWSGSASTYEVNWHDYRETDVVVALRRDTSHPYVRKPASKLINAWLAGVPAILGPEIAYSELGRPGTDYLLASTPAEAFQALLYLKNSPSIYQKLVLKGQERVSGVNAAAVTARWADLLFNEIPRVKAARSQHLRHTIKSIQSRARTTWPLANLIAAR